MPACFKAYTSFRNPLCKHCVCKWGAGPTPTTPRFIEVVPACFKVYASFDASDASLHPPNPPFYFKSCQVLQHTFETHDARILFAHGGGGAPPNPPPFFKSFWLASEYTHFLKLLMPRCQH